MNRLATKSLHLAQCSRTVGRNPALPYTLAFQRHSSTKSPNDQTRSLQNLEAIADLAKDSTRYPDLMQKDPILDDFEVLVFPPNNNTPYQNKVILRNNKSIFQPNTGKGKKSQAWLKEGREGYPPEVEGFEVEENGRDEDEGVMMDDTENFAESDEPTSREDEQEMHHEKKLDLLTDLGGGERAQLYQFPLIRRIVKHQTGKGKVARFSVLTVIGNGQGLVGYGEAKDFENAAAFSKSLVQAFKNVDYVERFEQRTVWTEMSTKLGSTRLVVRPRPVGFGLRCNPYVHQVLKAAGIKDASVKVWGSRNPGNVVKALFRLLHSGNAPLGMGNGVGGGAKKLEKGAGMRSALDVERERGRRMVNLIKTV